MKINNLFIRSLLLPIMILNFIIQYIFWIIKSLILIVFIPFIPLFFLDDMKYDYQFLMSIPAILLLIIIFPISFFHKYFKTGKFNIIDLLDVVEYCPF